MKEFTDQELIELGKQTQQARSKGGQSVFKKYGAEHFSKLGKISAEKRKLVRSSEKDK